jgi:hypothetical protein
VASVEPYCAELVRGGGLLPRRLAPVVPCTWWRSARGGRDSCAVGAHAGGGARSRWKIALRMLVLAAACASRTAAREGGGGQGGQRAAAWVGNASKRENNEKTNRYLS